MTTTSDLHMMGVTDIATAVAEKRLSPIEIADQFLSRISQYDSKLRAWSFLQRETTLIEAQAMTDEAQKGELRGPLHGVPFGIKEQFAMAGAPQLADWNDPNPPITDEDATIVAKLRDAGALLVGKTYMVNQAGMPPTRNPWNLEYSPGGSSSGSGAAVGARMVPFALSEQTGGSGIRPAAYNGVAGLKPTFGRNSRFGMFSLSYSQDHACIIATSVADLIPIFAVTAGYDPKDRTSRFDGAFKGEEQLAKPPKIGVVRNFFPEKTEPEMQACIEAGARKLAIAGAEVVDFYLPEVTGHAWANSAVMMAGERVVIHARKFARAGEGPRVTSEAPASPYANLPRAISELIPSSYYVQAQRIRRYMRDLVDAALLEGGFDAILMATAPGAAPHDNSSSGDATLCNFWSHLGNPALSVPGGLDSEGMPLGLQLVGPTMSDEHLLAVGVWAQSALGILPAPDLAQTIG